MLKKIMAVALSMVMLLSATGVFAAVDTTSNPGMTIYTENFDQYTQDVTFAKTEGYPSSSLGYTSDVFTQNTVAYSVANIVTGKGPDSSTALEVVGNGSYDVSPITVKLDASGTYKVTEFSYNIKFAENSSKTTGIIKIGARSIYGDDPLFQLSYDTEKWMVKSYDAATSYFAVDNTAWYTVVIRAFGGKKYGWILNCNGDVVAEINRSRTLSSSEQFSPVFVPSGAKDAKVYIDNAVIKSYTESAVAPQITSAPAISGGTAVSTNTNSVSVSLDQPLASSNTATLTPQGGTAINCTVTQDTTKLYTYTISWSDALIGGTPYTLDLSGLKNAGGKTVGDSAVYTFTTEEAEVDPDVVSSVPSNTATGISVDTEEMTVTFNKEMVAPSTVTLTGGSADITANVDSSDDTTFTFTWTGKLAGNTTYNVSLADFKDANGKASATPALSFTTEDLSIVKLTDSFEDASLIYNNAAYNNSADATKSIIAMPATSTDTDVDEVTLVDGYSDNTYAIKLQTGATSGKKYVADMRTTSAYSVADGEKLVATWRFRLDSMRYTADDIYKGVNIGISAAANAGSLSNHSPTITRITMLNGEPVIYYNGDDANTARSIETNRWYNIVYVLSDGSESIYFIDDYTDKIVYAKTKTSTLLSNGDSAYICIYSGGRKETTSSGVVTSVVNDSCASTIDDFTLWKIKPAQAEHKLALDGSISKDVEGNTASFALNFNQPVMIDKDMIALYTEEADGNAGALENERSYAVPEITYPDFCKQQISYQDLDFSSNYTLDYSGVTAVSGADLGENKAASVYEFTTEPASGAVSVVGDIAFDSLTENSEITFNLYSEEARTADIIAAFYNRSYPAVLETVEIENGVSLSAGINDDVKVTLSKDIDADYVMLYIWDGFSTMVPLMEEYKSLAPTDSLKVLMIGNSLTEDAQRYLNNMATAGGVNLDVTVKTIGGSRLSHHMNNLKAELEANLDENYQNEDIVSEYIQAQEAAVEAGTADRVLYGTYKNGVTQSGNNSRLMITALMEEDYDIISLQPYSSDYSNDEMGEPLTYLTETIRQFQPNAEIMVYQTWSSYTGSQDTRFANFKNTIEPGVNKWSAAIGKNVNNVTVGGKPVEIIPAGEAFYLADYFYDWCGASYNLTAGDTNPELKTELTDGDKLDTSSGLWRDTDHASFYGCYLADAIWYETITGKKAPVVDSEGNALVKNPTGKGPEIVKDEDGNETLNKENTIEYFEQLTDAEHIARLEILSDIAHAAAKLNRD